MKYLTIISMILLALAAFALPALLRSPGLAVVKNKAANFCAALREQFWTPNLQGLIQAANTYDAAVETHEKSIRLTNAAAIAARHLLYYQSSAGVATVATVAIPALGTIDNIETGTGMGQTVLLLGKGDTKKVVASEAIAVDVDVFQAASGKVATSGTIKIGKSLTSAAADDDVLEIRDCEPVACGSRSLAAATTLTAKESGATFILNLAGGFTVTLPANAGKWTFDFIVGTAPTTAYILLAATADTIAGYPVASLGSDETGNGNAAGDQINFVANTALPGDRVKLTCDGTTIHATAICKATGAITITG